jgi:hypothetical protein
MPQERTLITLPATALTSTNNVPISHLRHAENAVLPMSGGWPEVVPRVVARRKPRTTQTGPHWFPRPCPASAVSVRSMQRVPRAPFFALRPDASATAVTECGTGTRTVLSANRLKNLTVHAIPSPAGCGRFGCISVNSARSI